MSLSRVVWAALARIDIVATAQGRLVPAGHSKQVQPFESGIIRAIHIQNGDSVAAGDLLIELDPTEIGAERDRIASSLSIARLEAARLRATLTGESELDSSELDLPNELIRLQNRLLKSDLSEHRSLIASIDSEITERRAERAALQADHDRHEAILPLLTERLNGLEKLSGKQVISRFQVLDARQEVVETQQNLIGAEKRLQQADAMIEALLEERQHRDAAFRHERLDELAQAESEIASLTQELVKAEDRLGRQVIRAPVAGTVQELAMHTVGGVVTPAQKLMTIVPASGDVLAETWIQNKDIGFISEGQIAEVKIDSFPYTKYGLVPATVVNVSDDAIARNGGTIESKDTANEFAYQARLQLEQTNVNVDGKNVNLTPGMTISADIRTGERTVLEYLITPFLRYQRESLGER